MNLPSVSVCVPTYFGAAHIRECLLSIVNQSGIALQIIICDDQSSDGTLAIAKAVAATHPLVDWIIQPNSRRLGMVENWNACLALAEGEFIKMMGQDDLLLPGCLSSQAAILTSHPSVSVAAVRRQIINATGVKITDAPSPYPAGRTAGRDAAIRCILSGTNTVGDPVALLARAAHMRAVKGFDQQFKYTPDVSMIIKLLALGDLFFDPVPKVAYRVHKNSVGSSSQSIVVSEFLQCLEICEAVFNTNFTCNTKRYVGIKSKLLSLVRAQLYGALNRWPFVSRSG